MFGSGSDQFDDGQKWIDLAEVQPIGVQLHAQAAQPLCRLGRVQCSDATAAAQVHQAAVLVYSTTWDGEQMSQHAGHAAVSERARQRPTGRGAVPSAGRVAPHTSVQSCGTGRLPIMDR